MALPRFFLGKQVLSTELESTFPLLLTDGDMKHAQVLRLKPGEHLAVIDAEHDYFECEVVEMTKTVLTVRITQHECAPSNSFSVTLVQGIAKGDKMDEIICHATELGIKAFVPFQSARSIVKLTEKKAEARIKRWSAIAKSAAMQSGQATIPQIFEPSSIDDVCALIQDAHAVLIFWEEELNGNLHEKLMAGLAAHNVAFDEARVVVVVGPEGGLEKQEVEKLRGAHSGAATVSLGSSILRTETAGVVACALTLYELGGLS